MVIVGVCIVSYFVDIRDIKLRMLHKKTDKKCDENGHLVVVQPIVEYLNCPTEKRVGQIRDGRKCDE